MKNDSILASFIKQAPYVYQPIFGLAPQEQPQTTKDKYRVRISTAVSRANEIYSICDRLKKIKKRNIKVLDLGCNAGYFSLHLAQKGADVIGLDYAQGFVNLCEYLAEANNIKTAKFVCGDVNKVLNSTDMEQFDLVLGLSIFHHLAYRTSFEEVRRLLKNISDKTDFLMEAAIKEEGEKWSNSLPSNYRDWLSDYSYIYEFARHRGLTENTSRPMLYGSNRYVMLGSVILDTNNFVA